MPIEPLSGEEPDTENIGTEVTQASTIKLTGDPQIDALLEQVVDSAYRTELQALIVNNIMTPPKLTIALNKRAVYMAQAAPGFKYVMTDDDIAWLARSLHGEAGSNPGREKASAVAWTELNRFLLNPGRFGATTFASGIRGFSQPVNPKWARGGSRCPIGSTSEYCTEAKLSRRERITYGEIPSACLKYAEEMAVGTLEAPTQILVDFASYKGMDKYGISYGGDYFLTAETFARWATDKGKTQIHWLSGRVVWVDKVNAPSTGAAPYARSSLISYLTKYVEGDQRAAGNQRKTKAAMNSLAGTEYKKNAESKTQQVANAVQTVVAVQDATIATPSNIATGSDGFQVGSDDTWNSAG